MLRVGGGWIRSDGVQAAKAGLKMTGRAEALRYRHHGPAKAGHYALNLQAGGGDVLPCLISCFVFLDDLLRKDQPLLGAGGIAQEHGFGIDRDDGVAAGD